MITMTLTNMPCGQAAIITDFTAQIPAATKRRLEDLGLYKDRSIRLLRRTPFGGPLSIVVGGLVLALDTQLAEHIIVMTQAC